MSLVTLPSQLVFDEDHTAAAALGDGIWTLAQLPAAFKNADGLLRNIVQLGALKGEHQRGVDLIPLVNSAVADNATLDIVLHRISVVLEPGSINTILGYRTEKLYTITSMIASSQTYAAGIIHPTRAYRGVDTIPTPTLTARATDLEAKTGASIRVHSPADNTPAVITIPDMDGAHAIGIEATITNGFNCLAEVKT